MKKKYPEKGWPLIPDMKSKMLALKQSCLSLEKKNYYDLTLKNCSNL